MKILYFLIFATLLFQASCFEKDFKKFQDTAVTFAQNDNKIDEKEYNSLVELINKSQDPSFKIVKGANQEIDDAKLREYLLKLFAAKKLTLTADDFWKAGGAIVNKFTVNVYIENSASMDGYVKGVTEFETAIYNLLGDFKINDVCESLNLNYINKNVIPTKTNALEHDIQDFIEKLEPTTFKQRGGDRSTSDLQKVIQSVVEKVDDKNLAILVSDFVFSPGKNKNAQDYLNNQTVGIKINFAEKLKKFDLSVIVIQLQSNFDGNYYDKNDLPIPIKTKRPYYIWIIGNNSQINTILDKKMLNSIKGGYQQRLIFSSVKESQPVTYKILINPKIGTFDLANGADGEITKAAVSRDSQTKGLFGFTLAVKFSGNMQDPSYFLDPANYRLSDSKYTLTVEPITESDQNLAGFTHKLKLQTSELRTGTLKIDVIGKSPTWVESSTSIDDTRIATDDAEKQKTFGLKYLIEGVNDAFYPQSSTNVIKTLSISINK